MSTLTMALIIIYCKKNRARLPIFLSFILRSNLPNFKVFLYTNWPLGRCIARYFGLVVTYKIYQFFYSDFRKSRSLACRRHVSCTSRDQQPLKTREQTRHQQKSRDHSTMTTKDGDAVGDDERPTSELLGACRTGLAFVHDGQIFSTVAGCRFCTGSPPCTGFLACSGSLPRAAGSVQFAGSMTCTGSPPCGVSPPPCTGSTPCAGSQSTRRGSPPPCAGSVLCACAAGGLIVPCTGSLLPCSGSLTCCRRADNLVVIKELNEDDDVDG